MLFSNEQRFETEAIISSLDVIYVKSLFLETFIPTLKTQEDIAESMRESCVANLAAYKEAVHKILLRSSALGGVKYFAGMVLRHKAYHYLGVVVGWDPTCSATEEWIEQMNVDELPRGRDQPFYHVLCDQESAPQRCTSFCFSSIESPHSS